MEFVRDALSSGCPLADFPHQQEVAKRYFEDAVLTPVAFQGGYNPVFQWEGYARFEQFLLKFRRGGATGRKPIEKGAELHVLRSLSDIVLPFRVVTSPDGISQTVAKWEAFAEIRGYISDLNGQLWETITGASGLAESEQRDFADDFNSMVNTRMSSLNRQIRQIDQEIEKEEASVLSRITRFLIATLGSVVPGTAGMGQILDDAHSALVRRRVKQSCPALNAVFEYERILSSLQSKREAPVSVSTVGNEYEAVEYWDQV